MKSFPSLSSKFGSSSSSVMSSSNNRGLMTISNYDIDTQIKINSNINSNELQKLWN